VLEVGVVLGGLVVDVTVVLVARAVVGSAVVEG